MLLCACYQLFSQLYMLIEFRFRNLFSFKDEAIFNLRSTRKTEHSGHIINVSNKPKKWILRTSVIYWPNWWGKSNLLKGLNLMDVIVSSRKETMWDHINKWEPFLLNEESIASPSLLEVTINPLPGWDTYYRYGFEFQGANLISEWLFETNISSGSEKSVFLREWVKVEVSKNKDYSSIEKGKDFLNENNSDTLFLLILDFLWDETSKRIINWFGKLNIINGTNTWYSALFKANDWFNKEDNKQKCLEFFKRIDISIPDYSLWTPPEDKDIPSQLDADSRKRYIWAFTPVHIIHKVYSGDWKCATRDIDFQLMKQESQWTQKIFDLVWPLFQSINNWWVLFIDELDVKLHPLVVKEILNTFTNLGKENSAQLICTTHNTYLLDKDILRRDEVWFAEKNYKGESRLYSLAEFEEVRNDSSYSKDYLLGRYGAIPCSNILNSINELK